MIVGGIAAVLSSF